MPFQQSGRFIKDMEFLKKFWTYNKIVDLFLIFWEILENLRRFEILDIFFFIIYIFIALKLYIQIIHTNYTYITFQEPFYF